MEQKEILVVKKKIKLKQGWRYEEKELDIFKLEDSNGVSLGKHLDDMIKSYDRLEELYNKSKKTVDKFDRFIKTIAENMNLTGGEV